jgi:hypothetical protein
MHEVTCLGYAAVQFYNGMQGVCLSCQTRWMRGEGVTLSCLGNNYTLLWPSRKQNHYKADIHIVMDMYVVGLQTSFWPLKILI